jgi:hypothetical protein
MTDRYFTQCRSCSNPDRDGPGSRCRYFWWRNDKAAYLAQTSGKRPCDDERMADAAADDRYQDEAWASEHEFKRRRFWLRVRTWSFAALCIAAAIVLIRHGIGHHWGHR